MQRFSNRRFQKVLKLFLPIRRALSCFLFLILFITVSFPAVITVPADQPSIQSAINAASDGDEIIVSPGTYYENIYFEGKNVILRSIEPTSPTIVATTIIDANSSGSVVTFSGTELSTCTLSGFTIANGYHSYRGAGVYGNHTLATIQYNSITSNTSTGVYYAGQGSGIYSCNGTIQCNTISGNTANRQGGGLAFCNGIIKGNIISGNSAGSSGGGLAYCRATIQDNIISNNFSASSGGACFDCNGTIQNNTISNNSADAGGAISSCGGYIFNNVISGNSAIGLSRPGGGLSFCDATIQNNIICGNSATGYGGGIGGCGGAILNNLVSDNYALYGGGISRCDNTIQNNIISDNFALYDGGGLDTCQGTIQNNIVFANSADYCGGGFFFCNGTMANNTITSNSASFGTALFWCRGTIINCIVWDNDPDQPEQLFNCATPSYSCLQNWTGGGTRNISLDPQFVDPDNGDFHLKSNSPCIDAGGYVANLTSDFEGDPRPRIVTTEPRGDGSHFDIGADEFIPRYLSSWLLH
jgi:hypothetical protein